MKVKKIVIYIMCAALALYYCLVLWWGVTPNVGIEYRMYYITHELTDWPGYGKLAYEFGTKELCVTRNEETLATVDGVICARKGQGFEDSTMSGTWVSGEDSYVYYLPNEDAAQAVLSVDVTQFDGARAIVYAGDKEIGSITDAGEHEFVIDGAAGGEVLTIHFKNSDCKYEIASLCLSKVA